MGRVPVQGAEEEGVVQERMRDRLCCRDDRYSRHTVAARWSSYHHCGSVRSRLLAEPRSVLRVWTILCLNFGPQLFDCVLGNKDAVMQRAIKGVSGELGTLGLLYRADRRFLARRCMPRQAIAGGRVKARAALASRCGRRVDDE